MRKILISIVGALVFCTAFAAGENIPTSKSYVDAGVAEKQDKISANNGAAQVLTNTGTAGEYGTKGIYNSTNAYATQTDALIDAVTMNTAVQNAIDSEFQCVEYNPNDPTDCWLMDVFGTPQQQILPSGYTALEYIESDGAQYIDTGISGGTRWIGKGQSTRNTTKSQVILGGNSVGVAYSFVGSVRRGNVWTTKGEPYDTDYPITDAYDFDLLFTENGVKGKIDNTEIANVGNISLNMTWKICWHNSTYPYIGKLFYFKAYQNDELVRNFIPARRDSDGKIGMYDMVSRTFFTNAGTGEFIAGPVVNLYLPSGN